MVAVTLLAVGPIACLNKVEAVDLTVTVLPGLRGDADSDGDVDIFDAMFIAQYLVGLRGPEEINFYNAASVKHDDPEDIVDIFDAMFIAQYVVGLRDANFEWIE
jgi:hypothetical protein